MNDGKNGNDLNFVFFFNWIQQKWVLREQKFLTT